jgi:hypothetical protein
MSYRFVNIKNLLMSFIAAISFSGCFQNYYKASTVASDNISQKATAIDNLNKQNKYFILRDGEKAFYMKGISLDQDNKSCKALLENLPEDHKMYLKKDRDSIMRYRQSKTNDQKVFSEVHLFIASDSNIAPGNYAIQLADIKKIELIEKNKGKTIGSYLLGAGLLVTFFAGFFAVMLANLF